MSRIRGLAYAAVAMCLVAGCKDQSTGVHITVHLNGVAYDELRFGVLDLTGDGSKPIKLVDPQAGGRKAGLSGAPDPDVVVLLADGLDGHEILCDVAALRGGASTGSGDTAVQAQAHHIRDVDVYLAAAPGVDAGAPGDAGVDANHGGSGGSSDGVGGSGAGGKGTGGAGGNGAGGANGTGGNSGSGGAGGSGGANGSGGAGGSVGGMNGSGGNSGSGGGSAGGSGAGGTNGTGGNSGSGGKPGTGALGSQCTDAGQCQSLFCVDGVCCESACDTACTTCNLNKGQAGTCRQAKIHAVDPHQICVDTGAGNCGTDGTCDSAGTCANKFGAACTAGCASETSRFTSGVCGQSACVGLGNIPCPANMSSCVAGICQ